MKEYKLWYKCILDETTGIVRYHTYHGTKGLEFYNVVIIMENAFVKRSDKDFSIISLVIVNSLIWIK